MNKRILKALVDAGAVKKIKITAKGSLIYIEAHAGPEVTMVTTAKGKLKCWSTIDSAAKWIRSLGIGQMQLDMVNWQPDQKKLMV